LSKATEPKDEVLIKSLNGDQKETRDVFLDQKSPKVHAKWSDKAVKKVVKLIEAKGKNK